MQHSQIVICNYFWRHREQESCARAAAAHHMGLGHSPPAPMAKLCPTARLGPTAGLWADLAHGAQADGDVWVLPHVLFASG